MLSNQRLHRSQLAIVETEILRQSDRRLKPELCLTLGADHMDMGTRLLAREEEESEAIFAKNCWAHGWVCRSRVSLASSSLSRTRIDARIDRTVDPPTGRRYIRVADCGSRTGAVLRAPQPGARLSRPRRAQTFQTDAQEAAPRAAIRRLPISFRQRSLPRRKPKAAGRGLDDQLARLGLVRDQDLVLHLPLRYEDHTRIVPLADAAERRRAAGRGHGRQHRHPVPAATPARLPAGGRGCASAARGRSSCCASSISIRASRRRSRPAGACASSAKCAKVTSGARSCIRNSRWSSRARRCRTG